MNKTNEPGTESFKFLEIGPVWQKGSSKFMVRFPDLRG
jgi:hypothetical protein